MQQTGVFLDRYDLPLSTGSATAVEHYVLGIDRLLSAGVDADLWLQRAIEAADGFALAHAALAIRLQLQGKGEEAKASAERARGLSGGLSERERQHVEVIATSIGGDGPQALRLAREHLAGYPRDALILQQAASLISSSGSVRRREERLALHEALSQQYGDDWWFLGSYGFACHELDLFDASRRVSERSLALNSGNANASHNLAHVFYETSDHAGGAGFLSGWLTGYERRAPYHCHLSWHVALFELASGHYQRVLDLYERDISPAVVQARTTLEDAASLLWRYQIYGCAEAEQVLPWRDVCELAARSAARPGYAFADAHAALAYVAAGDEAAANRQIDGLRSLAAKGHSLAGDVVLPLAQGISAFAQGDYEGAIAAMEPVQEQLVRIGGSHAQQEVFEDTLLEAYLRAGRFEQAEALLRRRLGRRSSARDYFWLGRAQAGSDRPEDANASLKAARRGWDSADPDSPELARIGARS